MAKVKIVEKKSGIAKEVKQKDDTAEIVRNEAISETEAKAERMINIILIAIAVLIILGIAGWIFYLKHNVPVVVVEDFNTLYQKTLDGQESPINYKYNGFVFVKTNSTWDTIVLQKKNSTNGTILRDVYLTTYFAPKELEDIKFNNSARSIVKNSGIYMTFDPKMGQYAVLAGIEVGKIIGNKNDLFNVPVIPAVSSNINYTGAYPFITCANATNTIGVIEFRVGDQAEIKSEGNCVIITGTTETDLVRSSDRLIFSLMGIMP